MYISVDDYASSRKHVDICSATHLWRTKRVRRVGHARLTLARRTSNCPGKGSYALPLSRDQVILVGEPMLARWSMPARE